MNLISLLGLNGEAMESQVWDIKKNLILLNDGSVSAMFRVPAKVINSVDEEAKEEFKKVVFAALSGLVSYKNINIRTIPVNQELFARFKKLGLDIDWESGTADLADEILTGMIENLETSLEDVFEYHDYIIVPLKSVNISMDLKDVLKQSYRNIRNSTLNYLGLTESVPIDWFEKYENQLELIENALSFLDVRALSTEETIFLNRLQYVRGMQIDKETEIEFVKSSISNLDEVNLSFENINMIKLTNFDQSVYVSLLPVNELPENVSYLNLMEEIKSLRFPVESSVLAEFSLNSGAFSIIGKSKRAKLRLKNTMEEADETASEQKSSVVRSRFLLTDLQEKHDEGETLLSYMQTLIITGDSMEQLKSRYEMLFSTLHSIGVGLVRANADQTYLFYKNMIGNVLTTRDKNFIQPMTLESFCENLFFITRKVGTDVGFYIGRVDNELASWQGDFRSAIDSSSIPVYANLLQANKQGVDGKVTNNPHVAIIGETGQGKSFLTKLLFTYHSLLKAKLLYIDPKAEMKNQYLKILKELKDKGENEALQRYIESVEFVTLDAKNPENFGAIDPLVFLIGSEAVDLADTMIDSLLERNDDELRAGYLDSIDRVLQRRANGEQVGMLHVFKDMQEESQSDKLKNAGKLLERIVKNSILSLCFYDGSNPSISLENKITILEITGLDLPKAESHYQEMTKTQQKSLTVMYALGYFCKQFGAIDRTEETILFFDEAWFFNSTTVGRSILKELKRVGRSFNNFMVYISQSVKDLQSDDDSTGFGTVFAFLEKTEIEDVLDYLKIAKTKQTREWIGNMTMAQCIYYDTFGRKERITIDGIFPDLNKLFETVETKLKAVS